jgi:hypothetical protein
MYLKSILPGLLWILMVRLHAQDVYYARTLYADDLTEWSLHDSLDEPVGELRSRGLMRDRLDGWDLRIGDRTAFIRKAGTGQTDHWLLSMEGNTLTATTTWPGQRDSWRITDNRTSYTLMRRIEEDGLDWRLVDGGGQTSVSIYNEYKRDLRDWVLEYDDEHITQEFVLMALFVVIRYLP